MIYNAELGLDLSLQSIMDVGDVLTGQSRSETKALLSTTVSELLLRGSVPFLIGGSRDQSYYSAMVRGMGRRKHHDGFCCPCLSVLPLPPRVLLDLRRMFAYIVLFILGHVHTQGLLAATGVCVGVMNVSAQVDSKILDCPEFCAPTNHVQLNANRNMTPNRGQNCYGRYVQFGAQVRSALSLLSRLPNSIKTNFWLIKQ
jgi:hypothetical protein